MPYDVSEEEDGPMLTTPLLVEETAAASVHAHHDKQEESTTLQQTTATGEGEVNGVGGNGNHNDSDVHISPRYTYGTRSKLLLITMFLNSFLSNSIVSLIAPFLPHHIESKLHGSSSIVGILMSAYPLAVFFTLPICNILCRRVGRRTCLYGGELLQGLAAICFGYGEQIAQLFIHNTPHEEDGHTPSKTYTNAVIAVYFGARILEGFGSAAANLAITSIIADHFKSDLGKIMGINETIIGLGFTLGPPIGSALYAAGGFGLPFVVFGSSLLALLLLMIFTVTNDKTTTSNQYHKASTKLSDIDSNPEEKALLGETVQSEDSGPGVCALISAPDIIMLSAAAAMGVASFAYQEVFLAPYESYELGLKINEVGLMFIPSSVLYSILGPVCGYLVDSGWSGEMIAAGLFGGGLCNIVLSIKNLPNLIGKLIGNHEKAAAWIIQLFSLSLFGATQAFVLIPTLPLMRASVDDENDASTEHVVGIFFAMQMLGATIGSIVGGIADDSLGYFSSLLILGAGNCIYATVFGCGWYCWKGRASGVGDRDSVDTDPESPLPLLHDIRLSVSGSRNHSLPTAGYTITHRRPSNPLDILSHSAPMMAPISRESSGGTFKSSNLYPICNLGVSARSPRLLSESFTHMDTHATHEFLSSQSNLSSTNISTTGSMEKALDN